MAGSVAIYLPLLALLPLESPELGLAGKHQGVPQPTRASQPIDVLTVGHAMVDVLAAADDGFLEAEGLAKGTMHLIDAGRATALYQHMGPAEETSGGSAANTATGVMACGGRAAFVGTVANDQLGEIFAHDIRAAGVHYPTGPLTDSEPTGRCMILVTPDGERTMNTFIGVSHQVSVGLLDDALLAGSRITYLEGYLLDDGADIDGWKVAADTIHRAGNRFSISLSDPFCVRRHRDGFLALLDGSVDICFGNAEEVTTLFETDDFELALKSLAERCAVAAVTLGAGGSVLVAGDERVEIEAAPVNLVDTTGAGDIYAAGVLTGLARGDSLRKSGELGSRAAGAVISQMGARLRSSLIEG